MSDDIVSRVGGAILLAETEWTPKAGVSKERAMALAAIEAMREPTGEMIEAGVTADAGKTLGERVANAHRAMIDAALAPHP